MKEFVIVARLFQIFFFFKFIVISYSSLKTNTITPLLTILLILNL